MDNATNGLRPVDSGSAESAGAVNMRAARSAPLIVRPSGMRMIGARDWQPEMQASLSLLRCVPMQAECALCS